MQILLALVFLISMVVFAVGVIWLIVSLLIKKSSKKPLITIGVAFVAFVVSIIAIGTTNASSVST